MAIKAGMTIAEAIAQLTKGFVKVMKRKPEALEKIKIQQEAVKKIRDLNKVVDLEGNVIDTSKGIMGGKQIGMFDNIFNKMQKQMGKGDPKIVKPKKPNPEEKAMGGRAGFDEGGMGLKFFPKASGRQVEQEVGPGIKISERDLNYGITGLLQGDNFFGGAEIDKGKVKLDVTTPEGDTLFKDTIAKDDAVNFILGVGDPEGDKFQIKVDDDFENMKLVLKKTFAEGGRAGLRLGSKGPGEVLEDEKKLKQRIENFLIKRAPFGILMDPPNNQSLNLENLNRADRPSKPEIKIGPYKPESDIDPFSKENVVEFDDGTFMYKDNGKYFKMDEEDEPYEVEGPSEGAKPIPKTMEAAQGGRIGFFGGGAGKYQMDLPFGKPLFTMVMNNKLYGIYQNKDGSRLSVPLGSDGKPNYAKGGRIGYKDGPDQPGRRKFMKIMGGLATLPFIGKYFRGAEKVAPVAEKAVEVAGQAPSYFFDLVAKIKMLGKMSDGPQERIKEYSMKAKDGKSEFLLSEDIGTGEIQIKKIGKENDEMVTEVQTMDYRPGSSMADETTKGIPADDYEEFTEYNSRIYKDEFNDPQIETGIKVKEIIDEVKDQAPSIKKASGGIARMLGE